MPPVLESPDPLLVSDPTLLPYLAGFFDGEGSVGVMAYTSRADGRRYHRVAIAVSQVNPEPLHLFAQRFGGPLWPVPPATDRCRSSWRWQASAARAVGTLDALLPFLIVKREVATLALSLRDLAFQRGATDKREAIRQAVMAANHRTFDPAEGVTDG